jgi:hypothetical protein
MAQAPPVLGDFLAAADRHLREAASAPAGAGRAGDAGTTAAHLVRVTGILAGYCADLSPGGVYEAARRLGLPAWERAAIDIGSALRTAHGYLRIAAAERGVAGEPGSGPSPLDGPLSEAAAALTAGRDLLHTHSEPAGGPDADRSLWSRAVTSQAVTRAAVWQIARWAELLSPVTDWLAAEAGASRDGEQLAWAARWLQEAGSGSSHAAAADPVRPEDTALLRAIPAALPPGRSRPFPVTQTAADLAAGVAVSAARLRGAPPARRREAAAWSPNATAGGWRWMAEAAAVISHICEVALRALAERAAQVPGLTVTPERLQFTADCTAGLRAAWQRVDELWDPVSTESSLRDTPSMTDLSDLLLRLGRIVWDDPAWTPARSRLARRKPPQLLAPGQAELSCVVAAAHEAVDALACIAAASAGDVRAAALAGRFYLAVRSLPPQPLTDRAPRYIPAPPAQLDGLLAAYRDAGLAAQAALHALDYVAVAASAPSFPLALARAASVTQATRPDPGQLPPLYGPGTPLPAWPGPGGSTVPLRQALKDQDVTDRALLRQAARIDRAAERLLAEARSWLAASGPASTAQEHPAAGRLAAQSFPHGADRALAARTRPGAGRLQPAAEPQQPPRRPHAR